LFFSSENLNFGILCSHIKYFSMLLSTFQKNLLHVFYGYKCILKMEGSTFLRNTGNYAV